MREQTRLDQTITAMGLAASREKARALIMAGKVFVDGQRADKPGMQVPVSAQIELRGAPLPYVSRGGLKLEKAMQAFNLLLDGFVCADIGASTGGFTDCMLQNGAARVYAVDVGYGQLAWKLRCDARVVNLERTNFRYVTAEQIPEPLDFASVDVSFISLSLILPALKPLLKTGANVICLVKPQFEAGRENVGKKGVVRDAAVHRDVLRQVSKTAASLGFSLCGLDFSPIQGPQGNIEFLLWLLKDGAAADRVSCSIDRAVSEAHQFFSSKEGTA